jgi:hypothetical protein
MPGATSEWVKSRYQAVNDRCLLCIGAVSDEERRRTPGSPAHALAAPALPNALKMTLVNGRAPRRDGAPLQIG